MNPFEEYFKLEGILKRNPSLKEVFKIMVEEKMYKNINTRVLHHELEPNTSMGKYIWKFSESLKECLESGQEVMTPENFDENTFFTVLFVTLCDEEIPHEQSSGSIQVMNAIIQYCNWKRDNEIMTKDTFAFTFSICLGRIYQRYEKKLTIPSCLMISLYEFIRTNNNLTVRSLQRVVKYMVGISATYHCRLTDLNAIDEHTSVGKLSFLILSNIITRYYTAEPTRQKMLQMIYSVMEGKIVGLRLGKNEKRIVEANFRSLIWQSVPNIPNINPLIYAIVNMVKAKPQSKSHIILICNLPYKVYSEIVQLLYKLARRSYNHSLQLVLYHIMQTSYKTQTSDEKSNQFKLILKMTESIFWSMKMDSKAARVRTIQLIHCVLRLPEYETIEALRTMLNDHIYYSAYKLLNFSFEHTNLKWDHNYKGLNQYFLCIFCNVLIIRGKQYVNNLRQFKIILEAADSADLLPCVSILLRTYKLFIRIYPDVTKAIITVFCYHAISPNSTCVHYLKAIYSLTLGIENDVISIPTGEMLDLILRDIDFNHIIWKKLISYNLITSTTVRKLFDGLLSGYDNTWKLLSRILPNMSNEVLPSSILCHWKIIGEDKWTNKDIVHIFNTVGSLVELKISFKDHERAFFTDVFEYICSSLNERTIPTTYISLSLMTASKIVRALKLPLTLLLKVYIDIENDLSVGLQLLKPPILFKYNKSFLRVAMYFRELNLVFSYCITPSVYIFKLVSYILTNLDGYDSRNEEIISHVLRIAVQIGIKYKQLRELTTISLKMLVPEADFALKSTILYCFYDVAILQSGSYDGMIPVLYEFFFLDNWEHQYQAAKVLIGLINTDRYIPNSWEIHIVMNIACQRNVFKFFNEDFTRTFLVKCEKILAENFINNLLYFHKLYDVKNYELNYVQKRHMPRREVNMEKRKFLYQLILLQFSTKLKLQIVDKIFEDIVDVFTVLPLQFPHNYELLQDILYITYQATKYPAFSFAKNNKDLYEQSISDIEKLTVFTSIKKDVPQDEEEEIMLKKIITGIFNLFDKMDRNGKIVIPELFHLMLCLFNWNYDKIFNMLVDEGPNGTFRKCIHRIPAYFTIYKRLLHIEKPINLEDPLSKLIEK